MFNPIIYTLPEAACLALGLNITPENEIRAIKRLKLYKLTAVYNVGRSVHDSLYPSLVSREVQRLYPSIYVQYPDMKGPPRGSLFFMDDIYKGVHEKKEVK